MYKIALNCKNKFAPIASESNIAQQAKIIGGSHPVSCCITYLNKILNYL
jgi:hypothetical protein